MIEKLRIPLFVLAVALTAGLVYLLLLNSGDYDAPNADGLFHGTAAYQKGDYNEAAQWFMQAAKRGDKEAQYRYAMLYRDGKGVDRDDAQAVRWLKVAAAQKHADSQYELAKLFDSGRGMDQPDPASAIHLLRQAAEAGHGAAQLRLAVHYAEGRGTPKDEGRALHWAVMATKSKNREAEPYLQQLLNRVTAKAVEGDAKAQFVLAMMFSKGEGIHADLKSSENWLRQSAEQGNSDAQYHLAVFLVDKQNGSQFKEAASWYLAAARQGHLKAATAFGIMSASGVGVTADPQQALLWLNKAAEAGNAKAQTALGIVYSETPGFDHNYSEAVSWLQKAAASAQTDAQNNLAVMYALGKGIDKDLKQAYTLFQQAAKKDAKAQYNLGVMSLRGIHVTQNEAGAVSWFKKAESGGNSNASPTLALLYHLGRGVSYNETLATHRYQEAAGNGDLNAAFNLAILYYNSSNFAKAFRNFLQAANGGDAQACNIVASMYQRGQGVTYNIEQAVQWYRKAAEAGYAPAQFNLGNLYRKGEGLDQLDKLAAQWYLKAAESGYAQAQNSIAYMYALGRGVSEDREKARTWFKAASSQGLEIAKQNLPLLEKKQSAFILASHAIDMDVRAPLLFEKPLDLSRHLDVYRTP
ncbi:hypothetical protein Ga0123461_0280 [Mariprofundus aestuarium]|uniref:TPR repeat n=1 Tax=Mariprofundus aestuarium TaxID=1921086 RepID=A0A2K8KVU0_MARES|nr:tetratricopeptide repeat protein [Mariprofundus aestuarium]ATX78732.1 hypothetical protein Ga0123461_0280 [Mariprofundus aestuarium]